ncbi:MAG: hypothetical protein NUV80_06570 [Candidatus Berkelbacteria bacterium]|nr:hypothetical protein [Candidatus Berkelbacteria bacterium]
MAYKKRNYCGAKFHKVKTVPLFLKELYYQGVFYNEMIDQRKEMQKWDLVLEYSNKLEAIVEIIENYFCFSTGLGDIRGKIPKEFCYKNIFDRLKEFERDCCGI